MSSADEEAGSRAPCPYCDGASFLLTVDKGDWNEEKERPTDGSEVRCTSCLQPFYVYFDDNGECRGFKYSKDNQSPTLPPLTVKGIPVGQFPPFADTGTLKDGIFTQPLAQPWVKREAVKEISVPCPWCLQDTAKILSGRFDALGNRAALVRCKHCTKVLILQKPNGVWIVGRAEEPWASAVTTPYITWLSYHRGSPSLKDLLMRYQVLDAGIQAMRNLGMNSPEGVLREMGLG